MSQPLQSSRSASPLTARLYDLEYPRSLGVYSTYQEVQSVVDTLADHSFPVQSTLIVGTDLKLMERVTGRKTWPRVIWQGVLSGLWMGLFLGLLLFVIGPADITIVVTSLLLGVVFFTIWSVIGYAMTGGRRDFTSMVATIPMQYELLVEHKHAAQARSILAESGAGPAPVASPGGSPVPAPGSAAHGGPQQYGAQQYGAQQHDADQHGGQQDGRQQPGAPGAATSAAPAAPTRPGYGQSGAPAASSAERAPARRPSFGQPAGTPLHERSAPTEPPASGDSPEDGARRQDGGADRG